MCFRYHRKRIDRFASTHPHYSFDAFSTVHTMALSTLMRFQKYAFSLSSKTHRSICGSTCVNKWKLGRHKRKHKKNGQVRSSCPCAYVYVVALTSENGVDISTGISTRPWTNHGSLWPRPHANISKAIWRTKSAILFIIGLRRSGIKNWVKYAILRVRMSLAYGYALVKTRSTLFRLKTHTFDAFRPSVHTTTMSVFIENASIWKRSWSGSKRKHVHIVLVWTVENASKWKQWPKISQARVLVAWAWS